MNLFRTGVVITALLIASPQAWAYLDPGSASLILQGFIAGILSVMAVMRLYWHRIKQFFSRNKSVDASPTDESANSTDDTNGARQPSDDNRDPR